MTYQDSPYRSRPRYPALAEYEDPPYQDPAPHQDGGGYWDESAYQPSPAYRGAHSRQQGRAGYQDAFDAPNGYRDGQDYPDAFDGSSTGYQNARGYENGPAYQGYRDPHPSAPEGWVGYQDPGGYQDAGYQSAGYRDTGYQDTMVAPRTEAVTPDARTGGGSYLDDWQQGRARRPAGLGLMTGAVAGFLAAAVVLGIATLTSALVGRQASPVTALDGIFTGRLPSALRSSAVHHFGAHNRVVLLLGMYVVIAVIAMVIGNIARRKTAIGVMGIAAFGLLVAYIVITRPGSEAADAIPSVIGGLAGVGALLYLVRASLPYFGEAA
jgi:hypothetical protein